MVYSIHQRWSFVFWLMNEGGEVQWPCLCLNSSEIASVSKLKSVQTCLPASSSKAKDQSEVFINNLDGFSTVSHAGQTGQTHLLSEFFKCGYCQHFLYLNVCELVRRWKLPWVKALQDHDLRGINVNKIWISSNILTLYESVCENTILRFGFTSLLE